jgi:DNA repair exonuclease SbcCD ATPase subunit
MIKFEYVRWRNFLSTGNQFTEIEVCKSPTTLVVGSNGSGKSTFIDALCFALFNKPFRKIKIGQLINSINMKDALVEVEFSIGSSQYKVRRGLKPNLFEIYQNNILINQDAATKDYQEFLEKQILKLNYKSFTQIVVLGSSTFIPFMQLPAPHRREIIEDLLDIQIFTRMNDILKSELLQVGSEYKDAESKLSVVRQSIDLQEDYLERIDEQRKKSTQDINERIVKAKNTIHEYTEEIRERQSRVLELSRSIEDEESVATRKNKINSLQDQMKRTQKKVANDITFYRENDECSVCKQDIPASFKDAVIKTRTEKLQEIEVASVDLDRKWDEANRRLNEIFDVTQNINVEQSSINDRQVRIQAENRSIAEWNTDIERANAVDEKAEEHQNKLVTMREEERQVSDTKNTLNDQRYYSEISANLLKDTGIKTKIINQYLPVINHYVNHFLQALDFFVQFNLDGSFKETIKSRHRDDFSYASFSEGEKLRIDLSLLFTWRTIAKMKNSTNTNLLILDEVFDSSLDANGTEEFLKILNTMDKGINAFVISHKGDTLFDKFTNTIRFAKPNNYSRIEAQ